MLRARVVTAIVAAWASSLTPLAAYYHYNHFLVSGQAIQEKFDLNALPNRTLTFFITQDSNSLVYSPNDSFASIVSQVRQAADAWNEVDASDLRVAFGGLTSQPVQTTPSGLAVFEDLPPGLLAFGTRTVVDPGPNGTFWPITQGVVHLNRNLTPAGAGPSYLEAYFTTLVHEMGHALGLQHSYTSSAMSTAVTRSTSRAKPVDADDMAGISVLYGRTSNFGTIVGRVTSGGQGMNMASVVAIQQSGPAVSALTNPDGTYRIDGVPQGRYWVYAHPLPPGADFQYPTDAAGRPMPPTGYFETLFYQRGAAGTRDPAQFTAIDVFNGGVVAGVDFAPQRRTSAPIYDVTLFSYVGQTWISPAFLNTAQSPGTLAAWGTGLLNGNQITPGLNPQILGGSGTLYSPLPLQNGYLAIYLSAPFGTPPGPRHILFNLPNDVYVLPGAVTLVQKAPPSITGLTQNPDGTVTVNGTNMGGDSRVFFDGVQAAVRSPFFGSDQFGTLVVTPPQGANNQTATVAVYNADGQNSLFTQQQFPPTYSYGFQDPGAASVSPTTLPAGQTSMVEVNWPNARFLDNPVTLGFGSSDVFVRRVWVVSQTRLLANVTVAAGAVPGASLLNLTSGFQTYSVPFGFQTQFANPRLPSIVPAVVTVTGGGLFAGAVGVINGTNLALSPTSTVVTLNDMPAQVLSASPGQVTFMVPFGLPAGWAILRLNNGVDQAFPLVVPIDSPPPAVVAVTSISGQPIDATRSARAGEAINIVLANLDPAVMGQPSRLRVNIGGVDIPVLIVLPVTGQQFIFQAQIILPQVPTGLQVPLSVTLDGGTPSTAFLIAIR